MLFALDIRTIKAGKPAFVRDGNAPAMNRVVDGGSAFIRVEGIDGGTEV